MLIAVVGVVVVSVDQIVVDLVALPLPLPSVVEVAILMDQEVVVDLVVVVEVVEIHGVHPPHHHQIEANAQN